MGPYLQTEFPCQVIILLARNAVANADVLLELYRKPEMKIPPNLWQAVGNLLAANKVRGFASLVLADLKLELIVYIHYPERGYAVGGGPGCAGCAGSTRSHNHEVQAGYPPVALYRLTLEGRPGRVLVAPGRRPMYHERLERSTRQLEHTWTGGASWPERDPIRLDWLAQMIGGSEHRLSLAACTRETITWKGREDFERELEKKKELLRFRFDRLVKSLGAEGRLTAQEIEGLEAPIVTDVLDK